MFAFLVKRILSGLLIITLVSMIVYVLFWYGPKSPALQLCVQDTNGRCGETSPRLEEYEERLGYNNPIHSEYAKFVKGVFVGRDIQVGQTVYPCEAPCLGMSFRDKSMVFEQLKERFPITLSLAIGASSLYLLIGVTIGVLASRRRGTFADKALVSSTLILSSIPYYLVALLSMLLLTLSTSFFPDVRYVPFTDNPAEWASGLLLVWLVMGIYGATSYARFSRGAMVETLGEDYVRTARAKGLRSRTVTRKHALRAAMVPVVTIFGLDFAFLLSGTIFTEQIFRLNGIGRWGLEATYILDLPVVQATSLVLAVAIVTANIFVDLVYSLLDPRVRIG
jgi:peptide/nickel transport system permease protein